MLGLEGRLQSQQEVRRHRVVASKRVHAVASTSSSGGGGGGVEHVMKRSKVAAAPQRLSVEECKALLAGEREKVQLMSKHLNAIALQPERTGHAWHPHLRHLLAGYRVAMPQPPLQQENQPEGQKGQDSSGVGLKMEAGSEQHPSRPVFTPEGIAYVSLDQHVMPPDEEVVHLD